MKLDDLKIKLFADGADKNDMLAMNSNPIISGLTTNPTLMKKAGIHNYETFCKDILEHISAKSISFEVFSDDLDEMEIQAKKISSWGENVYVKIPITNTRREFTYEIIDRLSDDGVKLNITALMTLDQVRGVISALNSDVESYISVFAGRIADTGIDPTPIMKESLEIMKANNKSELIWASPRELFNVIEANNIGCHIITATTDILKKLDLLNYNLDEYSLDTVKMFYQDAVEAGYKID